MIKIIFFFLFAISSNVMANGTTCPTLPSTAAITNCAFAGSSGSTADEALSNYFTSHHSSNVVTGCFKSDSFSTYDNYSCAYTGGSSLTVQCYVTRSCPANYTLSGTNCIATVASICDCPAGQYKVNGQCYDNPNCQAPRKEVTLGNGFKDCAQDCGVDTAGSSGAFCKEAGDEGLAFCGANGSPIYTSVNCRPTVDCSLQAHKHNVDPYTCEDDPETQCGAHQHHPGGDIYSCEADPPVQCPANSHNIDDYTCADDAELPCATHQHHPAGNIYACENDPPIDCPVGTHHTDPYTCENDSPPPDDGSGDPPPDGSGDPPPDGSGNPPPGDPTNGSTTGTAGNPVCGGASGIACESTLKDIAGLLTGVAGTTSQDVSASSGVIYEKSGQTISTVTQQYFSQISGHPALRPLNGMFSVSLGSGSCPDWSLPDMMGMGSVPLPSLCEGIMDIVFGVVSVVLIVGACFASYRMITGA